MKQQPFKFPLWAAFLKFGFIFYFLGLFFAPEFKMLGKPVYVWVIWLSWAMLASGIVLGTLQVVSRRKQLAKEAARQKSGDDSADDDAAGDATAHQATRREQAANDSADDSEPIRSVIV